MNKFLAGLILVVLMAGCGTEDGAEQVEVRLRPVKYMTVSDSEIDANHTFSGTSRAKQEANLSFRVAGTVNKIYVKVGERVAKGKLIASLDAADYNIQLQQAISQEQGSSASEQGAATQIKSAEANFIAAQSSYSRIEKLYENNSVSLNDFEQAKANFEAAEASYKSAQANFQASKSQTSTSQQSIQNARNQVGYTRLKAPFSGVISAQSVEPNELVNSGTPIVTLSSTDKPEVYVGVPELLISKIKTGLKTKVQFSSLAEKVFQGEVSEVGYTVQNGSTYPVTIDLKNADATLRPGMPADVTFVFESNNKEPKKIIVPSSAVGEDMKGRYVLSLNKSGDNTATIAKKYVKIGALRNTGFEINEGINPGALIATAGLNTLLEGDVVRLN